MTGEYVNAIERNYCFIEDRYGVRDETISQDWGDGKGFGTIAVNRNGYRFLISCALDDV